MKLSVILVAHNMWREIPRTLQSLSRDYQLGAENLNYEVLVIDNGSSEKLDQSMVESFGTQFRYYYLQDPPPSPAYALNYGAKNSLGEIFCFMIDGAHLLTPGLFKLALAAFRAFDNPMVSTRYFFLGPEEQNDSILNGYCQEQEDALLRKINWPEDGYRLFEIGVPFKQGVPKISWFNKMLESNCLFMSRSTYEAIGGANEKFDYPGGGMLNIDLYRELSDLPDVDPVQLVGEGSFHQIHGGITTNVTPAERDAKVEEYKRQYREIRGRELSASKKNIFYLGHLPTLQSRIHLRNRSRVTEAVPQELKDAILAGRRNKD